MYEVKCCNLCDSVYPIKYIVNTDLFDKEIGEYICISCFIQHIYNGFEDPKTICQCGKQMKVYYEWNQVLDTIESKGIFYFCCPDHKLIDKNSFFENCRLVENGCDYNDKKHDYVGIYLKQPKSLSYDPETNMYIGKREYVYDLSYYFWYYEGSYFYGESYKEDWKRYRKFALRKDELFFESYWRDVEREYLK